MRRVLTGSLAVSVLAVLSLAALADPADLLPAPLKGWTAANPAYGESVITKEEAIDGTLPPKRIEVSRKYDSGNGGVRIALNTHDRRGVQIIAYVNRIGAADPEAAAALAAKGVVPFSFASRQGVAMRSGEDGEVTGAALRLGEKGTLTLEGINDDKPATVTLDHVKAYLESIDLDRMAAFVRTTNAAGESATAER